MYRACGDVGTAVPSDEPYEPLVSACPECGGTSFEHVGSGQIVERD